MWKNKLINEEYSNLHLPRQLSKDTKMKAKGKNIIISSLAL